MSERIQSTEVFNAIFRRRSLRRYRSEVVPHALIEEVLESAIWAPSAHNRQPWRFAVITSGDQKVMLAQAMGNRLTRDLQADNVPEEVIKADVDRSYERVTSAPVLVAVCLSMADMDVYSDDNRNMNEYLMAVQSVAMAGQNLLLSAHALGLGACWMCAPLFCPDVVQGALGLPDDWQPQGLVTLGYPAQEREKTRRPLADVVIWR